MNRFQHIDDKILKLKKLKGDLEIRLGREFYRKAQAIFGEDFTPSLALVILTETWQSATPKQKETWQEKARIFPLQGFSKIPSKNPEKTDSNPTQEKCDAVPQ